ncbi:transposase [Rhodovulum sulfidophilum]|nr:transposase [Rhodovulum sulfidophilum]
MKSRTFGKEFKIEAVRLVQAGGIAVVQASGDLEVAEIVLRRWIRALTQLLHPPS